MQYKKKFSRFSTRACGTLRLGIPNETSEKFLLWTFTLVMGERYDVGKCADHYVTPLPQIGYFRKEQEKSKCKTTLSASSPGELGFSGQKWRLET